MTRAPVVFRTVSGLGIVGLLLISFAVCAQTELAAQLGINGIAVPGRYAPLYVSVAGYRAHTPSMLRVVHAVGNGWRGTATISQTLDIVVQGDGAYQTTVPVYDPANPIRVELVTADGSLVASTELDLRETMRALPYTLLCKTLPHVPMDAEVTDVSALPDQWVAFDGLASLWLAAAPSASTWDAISRWVLSGGAIVLFTGPDFFRLDSPRIRELLPIANPTLTERSDGIWSLRGDLKPSARILESWESGPLILGRFGAGNVLLVPVQAHTLAESSLLRIAELAPVAQPVSLLETTHDSLMQTSITGPSNLSVLMIVALLIVLAIAVSLTGRRAPRVGWSVLGIALVGIVVLSGFMSNKTNAVIALYCVNTHLYTESSFGLHLVFSCFYTADSTQLDWATPAAAFPLELLPRSLYEAGVFSGDWRPGQATLQVTSDAMRRFRTYASSASSFSVEVIGEVVRIADFSHVHYDEVWLIIDGFAYPMENYEGGNREYVLSENAQRLGGLLMGSREPTRLMRELSNAFPLGNGIWLLAYSAGEENLILGSERGQKVRDITIYLVEGRRGE